MEEFVTCKVCMDVYSEYLRCPRVLNCGHTFCSVCIQGVLRGSSNCPTCRTPIENDNIESITTNYAVMELTEKYSQLNLNGSTDCIEESDSDTNIGSLLLYEGSCSLHQVQKCFRCMTCRVFVCGNCVVINHSSCKTLVIKEAIKAMRKEKQVETLKYLDMLPEGEKDAKLLCGNLLDIVDLKTEEVRSYENKIALLKNEICSAETKMEKVLTLQTALTSLKEMLQLQMEAAKTAFSMKEIRCIEEKLDEHSSSLKKVVESLKIHKMNLLHSEINNYEDEEDPLKKLLMTCVEYEELVYVTTTNNEVTKYGNLNLQDNKLRVHFVKPDLSLDSSTICLTIDHCLTIMSGCKQWPKEIFLQFSCDGEVLGDVIIRLNDKSPIASKAVLEACLFGHGGSSFQERDIGYWYGNALFMKDYYCCSKSIIGASLLMEEDKNEKKKTGWEKGEFALSVYEGTNGTEIRFYIWVSKCSMELKYIPTGIVEEGMEVVQKMCQKINTFSNIKITDSGWLID